MDVDAAIKKRKIRWKWIYAGALIFVVLAVVLGFNIADKLAKSTMAGKIAVDGFQLLEVSQIKNATITIFKNQKNIDENETARLVECLKGLEERKIGKNEWPTFLGTAFTLTFADNSTLEILYNKTSGKFFFSTHLKASLVRKLYDYSADLDDFYSNMWDKYLIYSRTA